MAISSNIVTKPLSTKNIYLRKTSYSELHVSGWEGHGLSNQVSVSSDGHRLTGKYVLCWAATAWSIFSVRNWIPVNNSMSFILATLSFKYSKLYWNKEIYIIHLIAICPPLLDISQLPVKFWHHNTKYSKPQWKSDCCMTSIVRAGHILGSAANSDKVYRASTWYFLNLFNHKSASNWLILFYCYVDIHHQRNK